MRILKQKKQIEGQIESIYSQKFTIESSVIATDNLKATYSTIKAMEVTSKELRAQSKKVNIDKIYSLQDEIAMYMEQADEFNEILTRDYATPVDIDEDMLEAELEALGTEIELEKQIEDEKSGIPSYLAPSSGETTNLGAETEELPNTEKPTQLNTLSG
ncbi:Charged multivesicular body protein 5 [Zancudomyces culisetae]|uniref:Charged multivesicular body protein 5 n=1 Tax=Zancudomyces culisetae TaxID=1213189 RepID=A0A1R1PRD7_ZANCU|nr:Charged multivesicular body protein 5 [Zancudomyces culisetae]OMH83473.1 Charged multivesicular body protein 5 [Zancudomyces culisetae]|eukprot:OMH82396.1 Charged multivesicular body protein 5 [Zancudomyces culisetae]